MGGIEKRFRGPSSSHYRDFTQSMPNKRITPPLGRGQGHSSHPCYQPPYCFGAPRLVEIPSRDVMALDPAESTGGLFCSLPASDGQGEA